MYIIGLTGGIACGKSAVSETLKKYGAAVLDVDEVTRKLLEPGESLFNAYVRHFGNYILKDDGQLNKRLIREIIFNHPDERLWINDTAHPILQNFVRDFLEKCQAEGKSLVVLEIPLIFEAGWDKEVDEVWAVYIRKNYQLRRLMERDKINRKQALSIINSQMPTKKICARADVVICNNKTPKYVREQVGEILSKRFGFSLPSPKEKDL